MKIRLELGCQTTGKPQEMLINISATSSYDAMRLNDNGENKICKHKNIFLMFQCHHQHMHRGKEMKGTTRHL
eukprot:2504711-Amphidinium_carterae.2